MNSKQTKKVKLPEEESNGNKNKGRDPKDESSSTPDREGERVDWLPRRVLRQSRYCGYCRWVLQGTVGTAGTVQYPQYPWVLQGTVGTVGTWYCVLWVLHWVLWVLQVCTAGYCRVYRKLEL